MKFILGINNFEIISYSEFSFSKLVIKISAQQEKPDIKNCLSSGMQGHQIIIKLTIIRSRVSS